MSVTKTLATVAATAAIALGAAFAATAPAAAASDVRTIVSDTWKPGFHNDGDGRYVRYVQTDRNNDARSVTSIEKRDTWAEGFHNNGDGQYERVVSETRAPHGGSTSIATRNTWAPGYTNDMSDYTRIVPNDDASQTATLPAGAR